MKGKLVLMQEGVSEPVCQRVHYGPLDDFAKSENYRESTWRALCSKSLIMDHSRGVVQTVDFI